MIVRRSFDFEAAHQLPHHPGKCRELHGHSYRLVVSVNRPVDGHSGMAIDFSLANHNGVGVLRRFIGQRRYM